MLFILNFFRGLTVKHLIYAAAAAAIAFAVWQGVGFVNDKFEADREVVRLEQVVTAKEEAIRILTAAAIQRASAEAAADAARAELEALQATYDEIIRDADAVKDEDNGTVAPVLRRTLDALGRM